mgnify:CR=1 FL=1
MEKKGEILNQLAIIADLLENVNLDAETKSAVFILNEKEFDRMFDKIIKKTKVKSDVGQTFSVKIGEIEFVFTRNKRA